MADRQAAAIKYDHLLAIKPRQTTSGPKNLMRGWGTNRLSNQDNLTAACYLLIIFYSDIISVFAATK